MSLKLNYSLSDDDEECIRDEEPNASQEASRWDDASHSSGEQELLRILLSKASQSRSDVALSSSAAELDRLENLTLDTPLTDLPPALPAKAPRSPGSGRSRSSEESVAPWVKTPRQDLDSGTLTTRAKELAQERKDLEVQ